MDAFYQTVAGFCFTLLGLWWAVVQFRHAEWMRDLYQRRAAYSVHLSFLVPGIMSLGAMIAGDVKILWRLVFIVACRVRHSRHDLPHRRRIDGGERNPRRLLHPPGALADHCCSTR